MRIVSRHTLVEQLFDLTTILALRSQATVPSTRPGAPQSLQAALAQVSYEQLAAYVRIAREAVARSLPREEGRTMSVRLGAR